MARQIGGQQPGVDGPQPRPARRDPRAAAALFVAARRHDALPGGPRLRPAPAVRGEVSHFITLFSSCTVPSGAPSQAWVISTVREVHVSLESCISCILSKLSSESWDPHHAIEARRGLCVLQQREAAAAPTAAGGRAAGAEDGRVVQQHGAPQGATCGVPCSLFMLHNSCEHQFCAIEISIMLTQEKRITAGKPAFS